MFHFVKNVKSHTINDYEILDTYGNVIATTHELFNAESIVDALNKVYGATGDLMLPTHKALATLK